MPYKTISDVNTSAGVHTLFTYVADIVPIFIPLLLGSFFMIGFLGTYFAQKRLTGSGDVPAAFASWTFITLILVLLMSLIENLVTPIVLTISLSLAVVGMLWLYFSRNESGGI